MNKSLKISLISLLLFLFGMFLYWPALNGTPIWDDFMFWFDSPILKSTSYYGHWLFSTWPLTVWVQKFLLEWWGENYFNYHLFNYLLHFVNSLLIFQIAKKLTLKYPFILALLFFFHPANAISVGWMIQIKTTLCFFFSALATLFLIKSHKDTRWIVLCWMAFFLSVTAKSASLLLVFLFLGLHFKKYRLKRSYLVVPLIVISIWGNYRLFDSAVTSEAISNAEVAVNIETPIESPSTLPEEKLPELMPDSPSDAETPSYSLSFQLFPKTFHYYFWQVLLPLQTAPVKGPTFSLPGFVEFLNLFFLVLLIIIFRKNSAIWCLLMGIILLVPYFGIIPAPFMNVTWVSDQHLYLALPFLLAFWLQVANNIPSKFKILIPTLALLFFIFQTHRSAYIYQDEVSFYRKSLDYNPYNIPISYNLTLLYLKQNNINAANEVARLAMELTQEETGLQKSPHFPQLADLYFQIQNLIKSSHNEN